MARGMATVVDPTLITVMGDDLDGVTLLCRCGWIEPVRGIDGDWPSLVQLIGMVTAHQRRDHVTVIDGTTADSGTALVVTHRRPG